MVQYSTIEFFEQLAQSLNEDPTFQAKTENMNLTLLFTTKDRPDGALLKLDHGKTTAQNVPADTKADFVFFAPYDTWVANHRDGISLEKLIMTGKVKFKGSLPKIMTLKSQLLLIDQKQKTIPVEY